MSKKITITFIAILFCLLAIPYTNKANAKDSSVTRALIVPKLEAFNERGSSISYIDLILNAEVLVNYSNPKVEIIGFDNSKISLNKELKYELKQSGNAYFDFKITDTKAKKEVTYRYDFIIYSGEYGNIQYKLDDLAKKIFYAQHDKTEKYDSSDIGYFTQEGVACKHTKSNNACSKCKVANIAKSAWFKAIFKLVKNVNLTPSPNGANYSCCAFAMMAGDWITRLTEKDDIVSANQQVTGKFNKDFIRKYVRPGDVIKTNSATGNNHWFIVYNVSLDTNEITILHSNTNSAKYGNCHVAKETFKIGDTSVSFFHWGATAKRYRYYVK